MHTFKTDENLYFIFEVALNGSLDELIYHCKGRVGEDIAKILFAQLINFLEYLQTENIMHRDLKAQNIMMSENYNLKVIDFGDAKNLDEREQGEEPEEKKESTKGTL